MHCDPFVDEQIPVMLEALGGVRDKALFALGVSTGLRVSELLQLRRRDVIDQAGKIRTVLSVYHAKGDKKRVVPVNPLALPYLATWLDQQERMGLTLGACPVFSRIRHGRAESVTRKYAWSLIVRTAKRAKLVPGYGGAWGTHSMRKTFARATYIYWQQRAAAGAVVEPLLKVQEALGHSRLDNTRAYLAFMLAGESNRTVELYAELRAKLAPNIVEQTTERSQVGG